MQTRPVKIHQCTQALEGQDNTNENGKCRVYLFRLVNLQGLSMANVNKVME